MEKPLPRLKDIEDFLKSEEERLALRPEEDEDDVNFYSDTYFETLDQLSKNMEAEALADRLDHYIPKMFDALDRRGDEYVKTKLYSNWVSFLRAKEVNKDRIIKTTVRHGKKIIKQEIGVNHYMEAFEATESAVGHLKEISGSASGPAQEAAKNLIIYMAPPVLQAYLLTTATGLADPVAAKMKDGRKVSKYSSYCYNLACLYENCLDVLEKAKAPIHEANEFIENTQQPLIDMILERKSGYKIEQDGHIYDELTPDTVNAAHCFEAGLKYVSKNSDSYDIKSYVFKHTPAAIDGMAGKANSAEPLTKVLLKSFLALKYPSDKRVFSGLWGSRAVAALVRQGSADQAALVLEKTRENANEGLSKILLLSDPVKKDGKPVALIYDFRKNMTSFNGGAKGVVTMFFDEDSKNNLKFDTTLARYRLADFIVMPEGPLIGAFRKSAYNSLTDYDHREIALQAQTVAHNLKHVDWRSQSKKILDQDHFLSCPLTTLLPL